MTGLRVSNEAQQDIQEIQHHYAREFGSVAAFSWLDSLEQAFELISTFPGLGHQQFAGQIGIPDLREVSLPHYPYIVFYMFHPGDPSNENARDDANWTNPSIPTIVRVLHMKRDIPTSLL